MANVDQLRILVKLGAEPSPHSVSGVLSAHLDLRWSCSGDTRMPSIEDDETTFLMSASSRIAGSLKYLLLFMREAISHPNRHAGCG